MPIVLKSENLNLLEPSGLVQACNGIALPFYCDCVVLTGRDFMPEEFLARVNGTVDNGGSFLLHKAAGA